MRAFRKRLYSEFRGASPDPATAIGVLESVRNAVFLQYLMVDSSAALFRSHRGWRVLGTTVKPLQQNWLHLRQDIDVPVFIRNSRSFPGISQWIGDPDVWKDVAANVLTGEAGGQRRRLGRLLFAANANRFETAVNNLSQDLGRRSNQQGIKYHILCGLSGGTGSGAVVDAVAQVCRLSVHPDDSVTVYAVLPERKPRPEKSQVYYHANAYAALKEINAMLTGEYQPWDVTRGNGPIDLKGKLRVVSLISNENARNYTVPMDDDETEEGGLSEVVGDYLFEKLVVEPLAGGSASPITTAENSPNAPERIPGTDKAVRSRSFVSFGIRRIAVPEEEIREYFTFAYAQQALNHLRYNHWDDLNGFIQKPVPRNYREMAADAPSRERWLLSDAHLEYVTGVLPQDASRDYRPTIDAEWDEWLLGTVDAVRQTEDRKAWLTEVYNQCQAEYDFGFRGVGVHQFYDSRAGSAGQISAWIRQKLEQDLIRSWQNGTLALADLRELATAVRKDVDDRVKRIIGDIANLRAHSANVSADVQDVLGRWARKWLPLGRDGLFEEMKQACREKFVCDTRIASAEYVQVTGPRIVDEIMQLETAIQAAESQLDEAIEEVEKRLHARLRVQGANQTDSHVFRMIDAEKVKATIRSRFLLNRDTQQRQTQAVRIALAGEAVLGTTPSFAALIEKWPHGDLVEKLAMTCSGSAGESHATAQLDESQRILGVSILDRLRLEYSGRREDFAKFLGDIIASAAPFLRFEQTEVQKQGDDIGLDPAALLEPQEHIVVHRPVGADMGRFIEEVDGLMTANQRGAPPQFVGRVDKQNEITVITVVNSFPARSVDLMKIPRAAYSELINDERQSARARLELHTADECIDLPDLYAVDGPPPDGLAYLILAEAFGIVRNVRSSTTGLNQVFLRIEGEVGLPRDILLGPDLVKAAANLRARNTSDLRETLSKQLDVLRHEDDKTRMKKQLTERLETILKAVHDDPAAPRYITEYKATSRALQVIATGRL